MEVALRRADASPGAWARFHETRAAALRDLGRLDEAAEALESSIALAEEAGDEPLTRAGLLGERANLYEVRGDLEAAIASREQALDIIEELYGPEHPSSIVSMVQLADTVDLAGDQARAISL